MIPAETFRQRVYAIVAQIPRGKVASYGLVALFAGRPGAARAVGTAMREVPSRWRGQKLPCHRVIKSDGSLTEAVFGGRQKKILMAEGAKFGRTGRVNMKICEWEGPD